MSSYPNLEDRQPARRFLWRVGRLQQAAAPAALPERDAKLELARIEVDWNSAVLAAYDPARPGGDGAAGGHRLWEWSQAASSKQYFLENLYRVPRWIPRRRMIRSARESRRRIPNAYGAQARRQSTRVAAALAQPPRPLRTFYVVSVSLASIYACLGLVTQWAAREQSTQRSGDGDRCIFDSKA